MMSQAKNGSRSSDRMALAWASLKGTDKNTGRPAAPKAESTAASNLGSLAMKLPRNLGMVLLAVWLIAWGVLALPAISFAHSATLLALLAIAAGILLLLGR
jgi:hypothetical protein